MAATSIIGPLAALSSGADPANQRITDFAAARFAIILKMYNRAIGAVYFLLTWPDAALIEQPEERH